MIEIKPIIELNLKLWISESIRHYIIHRKRKDQVSNTLLNFRLPKYFTQLKCAYSYVDFLNGIFVLTNVN